MLAIIGISPHRLDFFAKPSIACLTAVTHSACF
jgi:hypothetical protein